MPDISLWLLQQGMSEDVLLILVFIPILVSLTTFSRYITGVRTFGIYSSMVLALAYYYMGFIQGFTITIIVILSSWIVRNLLRKTRLHYLSRQAIVYTLTVIFIVIFMVGTSYLPLNSAYFNFFAVPFLPLAMIISVTDRFMSTYIKKDFSTAMQQTAETLLISCIGWALMRWPVTHDFFLRNVWIIPLLVGVNFLIGQYTGLRWTELIRFNQVIQHGETPDNDTKK